MRGKATVKVESKYARDEEDLGWQKLGSRLRDARQTAGFRQDEVADLLQVSRPTIAAIEAGKTRVHSLLLRRLAAIYHREIDSFFDEPRPRSNLDQAIFDQLGQISPKDRATIIQFLTFCDNLFFLRKLLERDPPELPAQRGITSHVRRYVAEVTAREERARLGLGDAPIGERVFDLLDSLGLPVFRCSLEDQSIAGILINHPSAGPSILVNAAQHHWRQVFTAVHEYGHFLIHRSA